MQLNSIDLKSSGCRERIFSASEITELLCITIGCFDWTVAKLNIPPLDHNGRFRWYKIDELIQIYNYVYRKKANFHVFESKMNYKKVPL